MLHRRTANQKRDSFIIKVRETLDFTWTHSSFLWFKFINDQLFKVHEITADSRKLLDRSLTSCNEIIKGRTFLGFYQRDFR